MTRLKKTASLALAFALMIQLCACSAAKPSKSGIIHNDAQSKPEGAMVTETVPPVTITPTDPFIPTISATPSVGNTNTEPLDLTVSDIMYISELCIGLSPDVAVELLISVYGITDYLMYDSTMGSSGLPMERDLRELNREIYVEGIQFRSIGIHSTDSGIVKSVDYSVRQNAIFDDNEPFDSESYYNRLYPLFVSEFGEPDDDYEAIWVTFDRSGMSGWRDGDYCWFSMFWGMGCSSVTGNDQFVIGVECDDPEAFVAAGGGYSFDPRDASFAEVYELMESVIGFDRSMTESYIEGVFGVELGTPQEEDGVDVNSKYYTYDVEYTIEGFSFDRIEIYTNSNYAVYHVGFANTKGSQDYLRDACINFKDMAEDYLDAAPAVEYPLSDDNDLFEFYDFDLGNSHLLSLSAYYTDFYSNLWLTYEDLLLT